MRHLKNDFYLKTLKIASELYPVEQDIITCLIQINIPVQKVNLHGNAINMWDSILGFATANGDLEKLLIRIQEEYSSHKEISDLYDALQNGAAYIEERSFDKYIHEQNPGEVIKIFLVYDRDDNEQIKGLKKQLKILELSSAVKIMDMYDVTFGGVLKEEQLEKIANSCITLLMLTTNFFINNENDCLDLTFAAFEMRKKVIPVLIEECHWMRIKFLEKVVPLPRDGTFISAAHNKNKAEFEAATEIDRLIKHLKENQLCG